MTPATARVLAELRKHPSGIRSVDLVSAKVSMNYVGAILSELRKTGAAVVWSGSRHGITLWTAKEHEQQFRSERQQVALEVRRARNMRNEQRRRLRLALAVDFDTPIVRVLKPAGTWGPVAAPAVRWVFDLGQA